MRRRLKRLSDRDWRTLDRAFALALIALGLFNVAVSNVLQGPVVLNLLVIAGMGLPLLWRRRHALLATAGVAACGVLLSAVLTPTPDIAVAVILVVVAAYSSGAHLPLRPALVGLAMVVAAIVVVSILVDPGDFLFPAAFFGIAPWAIGRIIRNQTELARELTEKAEREQIAREEEERSAVALERTRVARELHDVLAHNLSVMVIQASAARRVVEHNPQAAADAAGVIASTGRDALSELRLVFGAVRREDGDALGSAPGLEHLDRLASRAHRAGLLVDVRVEGTPLRLSPGADMAAYRVVQEALTNTLKHARGAHATVNVRYEPGDVIIEVLDDGPGPHGNGALFDSGGYGLIGMRERVALYGGKLDAGRRRGGGFAVRARLPVGGALV
jgi:signal transduction histidine kinase